MAIVKGSDAMISDQLVEELKVINKRAFDMALSVHKDPGLRTQLTEEATPLQMRLLEIAEEIERIAPAVHKQWFHTISESILDLNFAKAATDFTSLRLGDIIKWGQ